MGNPLVGVAGAGIAGDVGWAVVKHFYSKSIVVGSTYRFGKKMGKAITKQQSQKVEVTNVVYQTYLALDSTAKQTVPLEDVANLSGLEELQRFNQLLKLAGGCAGIALVPVDEDHVALGVATG